MTATSGEDQDDVYPPDYVAAHRAQAASLKAEAAEHGLSFEAYFVPSVADWVLAEIEQGRFMAPSEAVFVAMQVFMELSTHPDLQQELLKRGIEKAMADTRPGKPVDEVFAALDEKIAQWGDHQPPVWRKIPYPP